MQKEIQINRHFQESLSGMTAKGFTLIELLVVVLIIGILAAIALPQYQKAVEKSRLTEALHTTKAMQQCLQLYVLERGIPSQGWVDLLDMNCPIDMPAELINEEGYYESKNFTYDAFCYGGNDSCLVEVHRKSDVYVLAINAGSGRDWGYICYTQFTDIGRYICSSLRNQGWEYIDGEI